MFDIKNKIALITGAASGIGLEYVKELLRCEAGGVTIADIRSDLSSSVLQELENEFGPNKVIFVETNVTNMQQFEEAFKKTVEKFGHIDILVNNAGIMNDVKWEDEIAINMNGVIHGMLLGYEKYIPKYKSGEEGVIVNISSVAGVKGFPVLPIYCGTKFAIIGMTKAWGFRDHYNRTKVRVLALCPGATSTPLLTEVYSRTLGETYEAIMRKFDSILAVQTAEDCAKAISKIISKGENGSAWIVEGGAEPYEFTIPERDTMKK